MLDQTLNQGSLKGGLDARDGIESWFAGIGGIGSCVSSRAGVLIGSGGRKGYKTQ